MAWFPAVAAAIAMFMIMHDVYSILWRPLKTVAGTYEKRAPGEFAKEEAQYIVQPLRDPREFRFIPPKPETVGLLKFTCPRRGKLYVDGQVVADVTVMKMGGCDILDVNGSIFTRSECSV